MEPQGFEHVVLVVGIVRIERGGPFLHGGDDLVAIASAEFDPDSIAHSVFRFLEQVEQLFDRLPGDFNRLDVAAGPRR